MYSLEDLEDMNRKQLASMVARLEKKLENQQTKQIDNMSIASNDSNRLRPDTTGKYHDGVCTRP